MSAVVSQAQGIPVGAAGEDHSGRRLTLRGRPARKLARFGVGLILIGAVGSLQSDASAQVNAVFWGLVGVAMLVPFFREKSADRAARRLDLDATAQLVDGLRAGRWPDTVDPSRLRAQGFGLEPGEVCFIDGVRVDFLKFYGDAAVQRQGFVVAWGSLFAWIATAVVNYLWWSHNRGQAKKAAPHWRDPEPVQVWLTDRRYIVHQLREGQEWFDVPWDVIARASAEADGLVLALVGATDKPFKLTIRNPVWHHTLLRHFQSRGLTPGWASVERG
jgi:hypothetical protein